MRHLLVCLRERGSVIWDVGGPGRDASAIRRFDGDGADLRQDRPGRARVTLVASPRDRLILTDAERAALPADLLAAPSVAAVGHHAVLLPEALDNFRRWAAAANLRSHGAVLPPEDFVTTSDENLHRFAEAVRNGGGTWLLSPPSGRFSLPPRVARGLAIIGATLAILALPARDRALRSAAKPVPRTLAAVRPLPDLLPPLIASLHAVPAGVRLRGLSIDAATRACVVRGDAATLEDATGFAGALASAHAVAGSHLQTTLVGNARSVEFSVEGRLP